MPQRILVKVDAPGHSRWIQLEVSSNQLALLQSQTTGPRETLSPLPRYRLRQGETMEAVLDETLADLVAAGGEVVEVDPSDSGLIQRIAPIIERQRSSRLSELSHSLDELEREGVMVTRGTPLEESAIEALEGDLGVPLPSGYRRFLATYGSLHLDVYGLATTWILGAPMMVGAIRLDPKQASERFASLLSARRAEFSEPNPLWAEQPTSVVPLFTSTPDLYYVAGVDSRGRMVQGDLRYATLEVIGDEKLWADFDAVVLRDFGRLLGELKRSME